ncbi:peptidyl-prolyl cis-trans isomerase D [Methylobacterium brachiatum]|uniref:Parvulin-like PPIase n=1 Tax=Methylobacterium brachiatum TaxID=269660 RepID=A0AAJ1TSQ9_9HYPH|nr:peptidylprolyl isomerase [Methylobacterium brachiatum]MCB4802252.1 SurA N-terminal domain-containing protein [Methylobacterium brachiatum]MDQ0542597.1 peptidyl-prolyl cis-trans isomerase D [Methylobacterium brachiatum]
MLQGIRNASQHWLGKIVLTIIFALLIAGVGIFGVEEFFRGGSSNNVATVGSTPITAEQVRQAYQNQLQRYQAQLKRALTPDQARMLGLDRAVMSQLITEAALDQKTHDLGLGVPDASVIRAIHDEKSFQNAQGQFDPTLFYQTLQRAGLNENLFVREQRAVIARLQLAEAVSSDLHVPAAMREAVHRYSTERRSAAYLMLTPSVAGEIPAPTEDELKTWYEANKSGFRAPEFRAATLLVVDPEAMAKPEAITDADAKAAYELNKGRYGSPEKRTIQQIVFPDAAAAEAARKAIEDGSKTFEAIAEERRTGGTDLTLGTLTKAELFDKVVADAAFALPEGGVSHPVQGRFGTVLLRVTKIEPGTFKPFEEVEGEIRKNLALSRARDAMETTRDAIEDQRAGAKPLADIATERGLKLVTVKAVDPQGKGPDGQRVADIPDPDTTLPALFRAEIGGDNEPLRTKSGGYVWYDVTGIDAAHDKPLDEVRDGVKAGWTAAEIAKRLQAKGRELVEKLNGGATIEAVAQEVGVNTQEAQDLARNQAKDMLTADDVNLIFATPVGKAGTAAAGDSRAVFKVTAATMPAFVVDTQADKTITKNFQAALADDVLSQYISEVQKNAGVKIDQAALRRAIGGEY